MRDHRKLKAFELANDLVFAVCKATRAFPKEEIFGLTSQMRRAAVSVPANIVEGCARQTLKEYRNFLSISFGSLRELGYYIELSHQLSYLPQQKNSDLKNLYEQTTRVLSGLVESLHTELAS